MIRGTGLAEQRNLLREWDLKGMKTVGFLNQKLILNETLLNWDPTWVSKHRDECELSRCELGPSFTWKASQENQVTRLELPQLRLTVSECSANCYLLLRHFVSIFAI